MRASQLAARRSRTRGSLLLAMFAVVAIGVFLLTGMVGFLVGTADAAVRESLTERPATAASVQLSTRLAADRDAQTGSMEQLIGGAFGETDITAHRTVRSVPAVAMLAGRGVSVILASDPNLEERTTLLEGEWPSPATASAVTMHATAAAHLQLEVGDMFTLEGQELVVVATWLPADVTDPYWFADPAVASGFDGSSVGPVVMAEPALAELPVRSYVRWTILPGEQAMTASALPALDEGLDRLADDAERVGGTQSVTLTGSLADRVDAVQRRIGVVGGLVAVPVVVVAVIGLLTLAQLARLLASVRRDETVLLRARGASVAQMTMVALVEAGIISATGTAVGAALAVTLLLAGLVPVNGAAIAGPMWVTALVAFATWGAIAWRAALVAPRPGRGETGRTRSAVTAGATVLVVVAAGVSLWQFKLYRSPVVANPEGGMDIDPLTVVAPALTLLALAMIGLLAFAPAARALEVFAARVPGILPSLPSRQVARRVPVFGAAMLLITLAVSGTTFAAAYSQSWSAASVTSAQLRNGADLRVRLSPPTAVEGPASLVTAVPYLRLAGASDATTVLKAGARIADDQVELTALAADRMAAVMAAVPGSVDPRMLAATLAAERDGVALEANATELSLLVSAVFGAQAGAVETFAWLEDADGSLVRISLGVTALADAAGGPVPVTGSVPEGRQGQWRVLAVEATLAGADGARGVEVALSGLGREFELTLSSTEPTARATTYAAPDDLPIVVADRLASRLSLQAGDTITLRLPSTGSVVDAVIVGATGAVPTASGLALVADLPTLNRYLLHASQRIPQPNEVWIASDAATELVEPAIALSRTAARVTTLSDGTGNVLVTPALVTLWWGMAGALLLAALAVLAITAAFIQDRRGEVIVLRALGLSPAEQGKNRLVEVMVVSGPALVTGALAGLITSALTATDLAAAAAGATGPVLVRFDLLGWLTLTFALLAALVTISTGYASKVSKQARDTEHREEAR